MVDSTVDGIKWYSKFFGFDFPYQKYDQLFCPEFKFGAMENVGCVTFTENLMFRGQSLGEGEWCRFINVVLHELCHQWFGNLVTMTWWNDLWLNESFATFVSFLCMDNVPRLKEKCPNLWSNMNMYKNWGMETDELATNHPICKAAQHTDSAGDMINGITYGKGCSFLKQLFHQVGYDAFSAATTAYFKKFAWGNTKLDDFLDCLADSVDESALPWSVRDWAENFLTTKGVNRLEVEKQGNDDGIKVTQVVHENSEGLSNQKVGVAVFDDDVKIEEHQLFFTRTEPTATLEDPGKYYLLNYGDHGYFRTHLEKDTAEFLSKNLSKIPDALTRSLVWRSIQAMVKTQQLKSPVFIDYILNNLDKEEQSSILQNIATTAHLFIVTKIPDEQV